MSDTARNNSSSEEDDSDEEIILPVKKKSFGFRVAQQSNPQQAAQQVLSQIGNLAAQRQVNEVVVEASAVSAEKTEADKKALEERKRLQDAQALAKAQQAAALQAAAARVAQAQANGGAAKAQEEAIARAREAQARAQQEAHAKQQAALKAAQQEAHAKQLAAQKAQQEAQAKQAAAQKAQQQQAQAQAKQIAAQKEAQAKQAAAQKTQQEAIQKAQKEAQLKQQQEQQTIRKTQQVQQQNGSIKQAPQVPQKFQNGGGSLSNSQPIQQEVHAATGPKWSRTPSKVQTQGPQPEAARVPQSNQLPAFHGNSALRQTAQIQEQQLAQPTLANRPKTMVAAKPHIQADHLSEKFVEKQDQNLGKITIERGKQLDGAKKWMVDSAARENIQNPEMQLEQGPKAVILDNDACWQTQRRVAAEIQQPQVGRIQIPELSEKEIQRTIVAQPASYHKVAWNEFPEEVKVELGAAPRTKTQDWIPVNQEQVELQRSLYRPSRIAAVWPPPQDEILKDGHSPMVVKASDDTAWIQHADHNGVVKQTVWGGSAARINRVWPPPENDTSLSDFSGPQHMPVVQWPPPEAEQHEREQIEVLQKHIPTKRMERQWPPPPPQYQVVESNGEIETRYNPAEQHQTTIIQEVQPAFHQQKIVRQVIKN